MKQPKLIKSFFASLSRTLSVRRTHADPASFGVVFEHFKEVLDSNNKALETMTDMGEKLGGDYLFDIHYIKKAYAQLRADLEHSIGNFDSLTQKRYVKIHDAFGRIDSLIQHMIHDAPPSSRTPVLLLENISWGMLRDVGGKMAQLSEVGNSLKLSTPDAFVITTAAFDEFMEQNKLIEYVERIDSESSLDALRERIMRGTIPPSVREAIQNAITRIRNRNGDCSLAVRSSAEEEDGGRSFAGQFKTILNVPLESGAVERAYREVVASLFSEKALAYQRQMGFDPGRLKMAVACMVLIDAVSSGVIYSTVPGGSGDTLIISASWGLGEAVVEGKTDADLYVVKKGDHPERVSASYGKKDRMISARKEGGTVEVKTPNELVGKPSLTPGQVSELAAQAMKIEKYFGDPRDIEWAVNNEGKIFILQARPLNFVIKQPIHASVERHRSIMTSEHPMLIQNKGSVVQRGAGAGRVFMVRQMDDLNDFPKGAVLVARHDSSLFVRVMPFVSAIITETGTQTSHMAALCRELKVPTIVNAAGAMKTLKQGQEVTVLAGEDGTAAVYGGIVREVLVKTERESRLMEDVYEYRKKRYILRYISPLHLIDPLMNEFVPEGCRTLHDILRFIHEKSVAELVENAMPERARFKKPGNIVKLDLPVPAGILAMDIGGGLERRGVGDRATFGQIMSAPLKAVVRGMTHPGAWHSEAVALKANDFISSMMRMPDIVSDGGQAGYNIAVISREYMNLSIRFGYHFNMIDCYMSENAKNNHIYFRFVGGATDLVKRSRRLELIARILKEFGFTIKIKGDLLVARLAGLTSEEMERVLDQTGRLIAYARQLDAVLHDDNAIERYAKNFLEGIYVFQS